MRPTIPMTVPILAAAYEGYPTVEEWFKQPKEDRNWEGNTALRNIPAEIPRRGAEHAEEEIRLCDLCCSARKNPAGKPDSYRKEVSELECSGEFVIRLSKATGKTLYTFFDEWGLPLSSDIAGRIGALPVWVP